MFTRNGSLTKPASILACILLLAGLLFTPSASATGAPDAPGAGGFVIYGVGPGANALDVPAGSPVTALFSADLDASTVSSATLRLHGDQTGRLDGGFTFLASDILRFQPASGFKPGETVQVSATGGMLSAQGAALRPYTWGFTAAAAQASAAFSAHPTTPGFGGGNSHDVALGDLDGDGDLDALVANSTDQAQTAWLNDGLGAFSAHPTKPSFGAGPSDDIDLGDLDGDGDLDALVANSTDQAQTAWLNDGSGAFSAHPSTPSFGSGKSRDIALGDLDGDGDLDALVANELNQAQTAWLNDGLGAFSPHSIRPSFGSGDSTSIALGDLDGDGDLDALVANWNQAQTAWLNDGGGAFYANPGAPIFGSGHSLGVALGDLDGDGDLDTVVANTLNEAQTVWLNDGAGAFSPHPVTPGFGGGDSYDIALGDLDGDGDLDAVVANTNSQAQTVWTNGLQHRLYFPLVAR